MIPTVTFTPLPTPSSTLSPTSTPDITALGNPSTPTPVYPEKLPSDFFTYDDEHYHIFERQLHGRPVAVVFHKDSSLSAEDREDIANYVFNTWLAIWNIFEGFPFQRYLVKIGPDENWEGASEVGFRYSAQFLLNERAQSDWYQPIAHEIFHAWNFGALRRSSNEELWFEEGVTQYYGNRFASRQRYLREMDFYRDPYYSSRVLGTDLDVSLVEGGVQFYDTDNRYFYYRKGALVAYLIDQRLIDQGLSLDDLVRYMYEHYALLAQPYTTADILAGLNAITGNDWREFFDNYVYGTEPLPIDGPIEYLQH